MTGTATETQLCGKIVSIGDYVEVSYKSYGSIKGKIVELWGLKEDNHLQGRVESGWCFHDYDEITKHIKFDAPVLVGEDDEHTTK